MKFAVPYTNDDGTPLVNIYVVDREEELFSSILEDFTVIDQTDRSEFDKALKLMSEDRRLGLSRLESLYEVLSTQGIYIGDWVEV